MIKRKKKGKEKKNEKKKHNIYLVLLCYILLDTQLFFHHNIITAQKAIDGIVDDNVSTGNRDEDGDDNDMVVTMYLDE